jgi:hypothetical protein
MKPSPLFTDFISNDKPQPKAKPTPSSESFSDDISDLRPAGTSKKHIYQQHFTPAERRNLKAVPENDISSEIFLLRHTLAGVFSQLVGNNTKNKKSPGTLKIDLEVCSTFSRAAIVLSSLVAFHNKTHNSKSDLGDTILQALSELNPDEDL